ncbi:MAG: YlxM family DNA-binding protein [Breznakia sp.]
MVKTMRLAHDEINTHLDFYEKLLTQKQQAIMNAYYREDYSLAEIAENVGVTRSAVSDIIQRVIKILLHYEEVLQLVCKYRIRNQCYKILAQSQDDMIQQVYKQLKESESEHYE